MKNEELNRGQKSGMMKRLVRVSQFFIFHFSFFIFLASCSGEYVGVPRAEVLRYQTVSTYGGLYELATAYAHSLNAAVKADTLHPGMYAEYGVTLALMGHTGTACRMLNAEMKAFPESRGMVQRIKKRLMPDMLVDTLATARDTANLAQLASWAYDSLTALRPLPPVAPVIDSTDSVWISQQTPTDSVEYPIRLTEAMRQQHIADSIAAVKQAAIEARKQAQADRDQEKKAKEEARKAEQKVREQQREEERKQKAAQREEERKRKAAEREEARKNRKKK